MEIWLWTLPYITEYRDVLSLTLVCRDVAALVYQHATIIKGKSNKVHPLFLARFLHLREIQSLDTVLDLRLAVAVNCPIERYLPLLLSPPPLQSDYPALSPPNQPPKQPTFYYSCPSLQWQEGELHLTYWVCYNWLIKKEVVERWFDISLPLTLVVRADVYGLPPPSYQFSPYQLHLRVYYHKRNNLSNLHWEEWRSYLQGLNSLTRWSNIPLPES